VTLPSGRFRLETRFSSIGSPPILNTTGIVAVTALARHSWTTGRDDHGYVTPNQLGSKRRFTADVRRFVHVINKDGVLGTQRLWAYPSSDADDHQ
jgi:hypothetical protein